MLTSTNQYLQKLQHSAILYRCSLRASRKWLYLYLKNTEIPRNIPKPQNKSPLNPRKKTCSTQLDRYPKNASSQPITSAIKQDVLD